MLAALRYLPRLWGGGRNKVDRSEIDERLLVGSWKRLVLAAPDLEQGCVDWKAYTFCVLEQFHRLLRRRDIFATNSSKRSDPRAKLLSGASWEATKPKVLASLELPVDPDALLAGRFEQLDATYREVADRLTGNTAVRFDEYRAAAPRRWPRPARPGRRPCGRSARRGCGSPCSSCSCSPSSSSREPNRVVCP